jgi:transposase
VARREFKLNLAETQEIECILKHGGDDAVYDRLRAVWEYSRGQSLAHIQQRYGCCRSALMNWCAIYRQRGVDGLVRRCQGGNNARLSESQLADLTRRMAETTPAIVFGHGNGDLGDKEWTAKDLYRAVRQWYGVVYNSQGSYYRLLKRINWLNQVELSKS